MLLEILNIACLEKIYVARDFKIICTKNLPEIFKKNLNK